MSTSWVRLGFEVTENGFSPQFIITPFSACSNVADVVPMTAAKVSFNKTYSILKEMDCVSEYFFYRKLKLDSKSIVLKISVATYFAFRECASSFNMSSENPQTVKFPSSFLFNHIVGGNLEKIIKLILR